MPQAHGQVLIYIAWLLRAYILVQILSYSMRSVAPWRKQSSPFWANLPLISPISRSPNCVYLTLRDITCHIYTKRPEPFFLNLYFLFETWSLLQYKMNYCRLLNAEIIKLRLGFCFGLFLFFWYRFLHCVDLAGLELCRSGKPWIYRDLPVSPNAKIKGMRHYAWQNFFG